MKFNNLILKKEEDISIVTINRPENLNALNIDTIDELHQVLKELNESKETRVIILTGSGDKAFVAGADIKEFLDFSEEQGKELAQKGQLLLFDFIQNMKTPVIAAINGYALGGGLELALAAHIRIACKNARLGLPEVSLGVIPGYGGTQRLTQLAGKGKALEMILSAAMISADDAKAHSIVNHVVALEELMPFTLQLAQKISKNSTSAIAAAIEAINAGINSTIGYQTEISNFASCFGSKDFKTGTKAFINKKKPNFK